LRSPTSEEIFKKEVWMGLRWYFAFAKSELNNLKPSIFMISSNKPLALPQLKTTAQLNTMDCSVLVAVQSTSAFTFGQNCAQLSESIASQSFLFSD
jgi:hypothetical protein